MFGWVLGSLILLALLSTDEQKSSGEVEEVRKNLRKSEFDNFESQEIARRLRTDNYFRQEHEKNLRRGVKYEDSIKELMRDDN